MKSGALTRRRFLRATGTAALSLPFLERRSRAANIPQTLAELWAGFPELDRTTPLETEVLKEWENDGVVCRIVRYQVGVFKGAPSRVAAFYITVSFCWQASNGRVFFGSSRIVSE